MEDLEIWAEIPEFPDYQISNLGNIYNTVRRCEMQTSTTREGDVKVSLTGLDRRRTMSVKYLVADAFVYQPTDLFNKVIQLDGNRGNISAFNLAWRPAWFAWKYAVQFRHINPDYLDPRDIFDHSTGNTYSSIIDAATSTGSLMIDVWASCMVGGTIIPNQGPFSFV